MEDHLPEFTSAQWEFLAILKAFDQPVSVDVVCALTKLTPGALLDLIRFTTEKRWLLADEHNLFSLSKGIPKQIIKKFEQINTTKRIISLLEKLKEVGLDDQIDPVAHNILLDKSGQISEACNLQQELFNKDMENGDLETAAKHLNAIVTRLKPLLGNPEYDPMFVWSVLNLSHLHWRLLDHHGELPDLLQLAIDTARRLGDRRSQALLSLHIGRFYHYNERDTKTLSILASGLEQINELGDGDILSQSEEFRGLYCYIQGLFPEAAPHLDRAVQTALGDKNIHMSFRTPIYLGICTALMGEYQRSIGVLDGYWRRTQMAGEYITSTYYRAILGTILLMAGNHHDAIFHLHAAEKEARSQDNSRALFWSQRALSYHHFIEGRIRESYDLAFENLSREQQVGNAFKRYIFPWMLEQLYEFHSRGYRPLPSYDFEDQLARSINGTNINMRGVALRIRAHQATAKGREPHEIMELLKRSKADLKKSGDPVNLAKTSVEMAKLSLRIGDDKASRTLALQAWELVSGYGREFISRHFPDGMLDSLMQDISMHQLPNVHDETMERFMDMIDEFFPTATIEELNSRIISAISRFFGAERGGLFLFKDNRPRLLAGYNLTRHEADMESFRFNRGLILKAYNNKQPLVVHPKRTHQKNSSLSAVLCLPVELKPSHTWFVLYHDSTYTDQSFAFLDRTILIRLAQHLSAYGEQIYNYFNKIKSNAHTGPENPLPQDTAGAWELKAQSPVMLDLLSRARQVADSEASVLILGETGVGKELLARQIHAMSSRSHEPFIEVELTSIPETLVESELFGHEKGAFTGADRQKKGRMELAHKGTLFIDEVGDIPKAVQVKILRALQEKTYVRVGGTSKLTSDFRLIAATNRDLEKAVAQGQFREDLYYRLNVVPLTIPPLKYRGKDIVLLAQHFLEIYARKYDRHNIALSAEDKAKLRDYHWPGNVRELKNIIERAVILSNGESPEFILPVGVKPAQTDQFTTKPTLEELQRQYIHHILQKTAGRISGPSGAAEILGIKRTTLYTRMKKLGLM